MKIEPFDEANTSLNLPEPIDGIEAVPAFQGTAPTPFDSATPVTICCWTLNPLEVQELIKTGRIWLWIYSHELPIHSMTVQSPFDTPIDPETN